MYCSSIKIVGSEINPTKAIFEPWGMPYIFNKSYTYDIMGESDFDGELVIHNSDNEVVIYGWHGCTLKIYVASEIILDFGPPLPAFRIGMSAKNFTNFMFGKSNNKKKLMWFLLK